VEDDGRGLLEEEGRVVMEKVECGVLEEVEWMNEGEDEEEQRREGFTTQSGSLSRGVRLSSPSSILASL